MRKELFIIYGQGLDILREATLFDMSPMGATYFWQVADGGHIFLARFFKLFLGGHFFGRSPRGSLIFGHAKSSAPCP